MHHSKDVEGLPELQERLSNAESAILRAQEKISESSLLRAKTLSIKVSGLMPAVKIPTEEGK